MNNIKIIIPEWLKAHADWPNHVHRKLFATDIVPCWSLWGARCNAHNTKQPVPCSYIPYCKIVKSVAGTIMGMLDKRKIRIGKEPTRNNLKLIKVESTYGTEPALGFRKYIPVKLNCNVEVGDLVTSDMVVCDD